MRIIEKAIFPDVIGPHELSKHRAEQDGYKQLAANRPDKAYRCFATLQGDVDAFLRIADNLAHLGMGERAKYYLGEVTHSLRARRDIYSLEAAYKARILRFCINFFGASIKSTNIPAWEEISCSGIAPNVVMELEVRDAVNSLESLWVAIIGSRAELNKYARIMVESSAFVPILFRKELRPMAALSTIHRLRALYRIAIDFLKSHKQVLHEATIQQDCAAIAAAGLRIEAQNELQNI